MAGAVRPVGGQQLQALVLQLSALLLVPVGLNQGPALLPVVEQEGAKDDTEIGYTVVGIESAVGQGADGLAQEHGVNQLGLVTQLGVRIEHQLHSTVGLLSHQLSPLLSGLADGLRQRVLKTQLQGHFVTGGGGSGGTGTGVGVGGGTSGGVGAGGAGGQHGNRQSAAVARARSFFSLIVSFPFT